MGLFAVDPRRFWDAPDMPTPLPASQTHLYPHSGYREQHRLSTNMRQRPCTFGEKTGRSDPPTHTLLHKSRVTTHNTLVGHLANTPQPSNHTVVQNFAGHVVCVAISSDSV
mmetsp:Transcript_32971/g.55149  ORF Transcript_32971/g.55149 Transcript_32971/m.55149 type:complete len:111 (-) Transcript_32971:1103-1435(-)